MISQSSAELHLQRAWKLLESVESAVEPFRESVLAHDAQMQNDDQPFLSTIVSDTKRRRNLSQQKTSLTNDISLANREIDEALRIDSEATLSIPAGSLTANHIRALLLNLNGAIELLWGRSDEAKRILNSSLQLAELPDAHYWLGFLLEAEYKPKEALEHFEKCLELNEDGEFAVSALREAEAMRNYKKKFRGNWLLLVFLFFLYIIPGVIYFKVKYK